ncbi:MAG TPA: helix-turn-helix domain-containing protein [Ktedonobacterales bacterium]|nr:helix-turn-helix domain-containing protein [Ktedonobacterales bacterium]
MGSTSYTTSALITPFEEWESCSNTLWVGRDGLLGYVSPAERHQESCLHQDGMYVLEYTNSGDQDVLVNGDWRIVPAQHVLWTSPHAWHAHRVTQSIESIYFILLPEVVDEIWQHSETDAGVPPPLAIIPARGSLAATMHRALVEARERRPGYVFLLTLLLRQVVTECFRALRQPGLDIPAIETSRTLVVEPLRQAVEILRAEHDRTDLLMPEVARRVGFSLFHFSRRFKDELGVTPGHYLRHLRLTHALPLLLHSELTLDAIAYLSGFGAARRLAEACKEAFGHTPSEIRAAGGVQFVAVDPPAQECAHA